MVAPARGGNVRRTKGARERSDSGGCPRQGRVAPAMRGKCPKDKGGTSPLQNHRHPGESRDPEGQRRRAHSRTISITDHPFRSRKPPLRKAHFTPHPLAGDYEGVQCSDSINAADHQLSISQSSKMTARVSPNKNNRPRKALANSPFTVTSSPMSTDAILRLVVNLHSTYRSSANVNGSST